jgi:LemA protein
MDELAGTQNRLTVARTYYSDVVRNYYTNLRKFPNNVSNENGFIGVKAWEYDLSLQYSTSVQVSGMVPQATMTDLGP